MSDQFRTCPMCGRLLLDSGWPHDCPPKETQVSELDAERDALTDSGHKVGDPCEAIVAQFVYGPQTCMKTSVTVDTDPTWGTTHAACAEHGPRVTPPDGGRT